MARYEADVLYIGSIYPGQLEPIRRNYGPSRESAGPKAVRSTCFKLEPVARGGKPFVLEIMDSFEDVIDVVNQSAERQGPHRPKLPKPVPVETIVADLLSNWTGGLYNVPAGATPGIIQIASKVPTRGELAEMMERQTLYFNYFFTEGERLHQEKNWKEITGVMRLAAEWLGKKTLWSHRDMAEASSPCPACTNIIPDAAIVCPVCRTTVRAMPPELAALNAPQMAHATK